MNWIQGALYPPGSKCEALTNPAPIQDLMSLNDIKFERKNIFLLSFILLAIMRCFFKNIFGLKYFRIIFCVLHATPPHFFELNEMILNHAYVIRITIVSKYGRKSLNIFLGRSIAFCWTTPFETFILVIDFSLLRIVTFSPSLYSNWLLRYSLLKK